MISSLEEAEKALLKFIPPKNSLRRYSLERMHTLMGHIGNPQNKLKVIHVAGTSGKTSTSYYVASLLSNTGKKVGLSVSPHIDQVSERAQVNLETLPDKDYCRYLDRFLQKIETTELTPTYFEVLVAFAYWLFSELEVDYAVIEVGLGGLLDGTNVVRRADKVCVITDIGLDHTSVLGNTIPEIAYQKAGIITEHNMAFMHRQSKEVMDTVNAVAHKHSATIVEVPDDKSLYTDLPEFQERNFRLAFAVFEYIRQRDKLAPLSISSVNKSKKIRVPARMEITKHNDKIVIFDGSHNQQKLHALATSIINRFPDEPISLLVSFGSNKEQHIMEALQELKRISGHITLTAFSLGQDEPRRPIAPETLAVLCKKVGFAQIDVAPDPGVAFSKLLRSDSPVILVTGSFYLLNHVRGI